MGLTQLFRVGMGLTFSGCAVAIVSLFLPLVQQPSVLQQVNDNSMIQSHGFGSALIALAVIVALLLSWAYYNRAAGAGNPRFEGRKPSWGVAVYGLIPIIEACVVLGSSDFGQLYGAQSGAYVEVGAGMALYLLLFGASLIVAGGLMMWRSAYVPDVSNRAAPAYSPPPEPPTAPPDPRVAARPDTIAETEPQSDGDRPFGAVGETAIDMLLTKSGFVLLLARCFLGITLISCAVFVLGLFLPFRGQPATLALESRSLITVDPSAAYIGGAYVAAVLALSLAYYLQNLRYLTSHQIPREANIAVWGVGILSLAMAIALFSLLGNPGDRYFVIASSVSSQTEHVGRGVAVYILLASSVVLTFTGMAMFAQRTDMREGLWNPSEGEPLSDEERAKFRTDVRQSRTELRQYLDEGGWKASARENEFLASPPVSELTPNQVATIRERIKVLKMRRDSGSISADEFEAQKAELFRQI